VKAERVGPDERLRVTVLFSLILHAVVVLGITFRYDDPGASLPSLDVILVQSAAATRPEQADFLANASQLGGGESEKSTRPREPLTGPVPKASSGLAPLPQKAGAPRPKPATPQSLLTGANTDFALRRVTESNPEIPELDRVTTRELIERDLEMARLAAEVDRERAQYAKRPRRKFVSANTREYAFAGYMRAWVARIERLGNLNYPEEARRRGIQGELTLTVAIRLDGSIESIAMIRSSGHDFLDLAARHIVELGAPYAPLPHTSENIDVLHITRTWQFLPDGEVRGQ